MSVLRYWVWLASLPHVGAAAAGTLLRRFVSPEMVFAATAAELRETWLSDEALRSILAHNFSAADKILADCERTNTRVLTLGDIEYSDRLRNIYDPPIVIYLRGRLPAIDSEPVFGVVGTRTATPYGIRMAEKTGYELARYGFVVSTGLARGIDSSAAIGALRGGGRVIGVLGGGVDVIYPRENERLFEDIAAQGVLISEYPPGAPTASGHFPMRNRILSGLSLGVGIIEAPLKSGALITASRALEQGRDVFAMPGNTDSPQSAGANRLLREGAIPLLSAEDAAREYQPLFPERIALEGKPVVPLGKRESQKLVISQLSQKPSSQKPETQQIETPQAEPPPQTEAPVMKAPPVFNAQKASDSLSEPLKTVFLALASVSVTEAVYIDELIANCSLASSEIIAGLTILEIEGLILSAGAGYYKIRS